MLKKTKRPSRSRRDRQNIIVADGDIIPMGDLFIVPQFLTESMEYDKAMEAALRRLLATRKGKCLD